MNFTKAINELLFQHECVVVPGFGGFLVKQENAHFNSGLNRFYPPAGTVYFNADLKASDGLIANYIANEHEISYREASDAIENWVNDVKNIITAKGFFVLQGIGSFSAGREGNMEFAPDENANFLLSSFGLPVFTPHQIVYNEAGNKVVGLRKERNTAHIVGETLKWAAALLPFAFVATWSALNINTINNVVKSEAALFPWTFSTPGKSAHIVVTPGQNNQISLPEQSAGNTCNYESHAALNAYAGYSAIHNYTSVKPAAEAAYLIDNEYYIVGGAFKEYNNALRYTEQMKSLGYASGMLGVNDKGLYVVYIQSCTSQSDALVQLSGIRKAVQPKAWLFRNN
jgi:nucleoid DNA-binding protein